MKIELIQLTNLCNKFDVEFKLEPHPVFKTQIIYCFGPIKWQKQVTDPLEFFEYWEISIRLAATYPEKVLGK